MLSERWNWMIHMQKHTNGLLLLLAVVVNFLVHVKKSRVVLCSSNMWIKH
jgi:hypothetical protein